MTITSPVPVGAHVDREDPVAAAQARSGGLAQFFLGDPQAWTAPEVAYSGGAEALRAAATEAGIGLYIHAPYVLNVATTNNRIRIPSRKLLQQHADGAVAVGARGLIVHGGHVGKADDPRAGVDNWRKTVERLETAVPLLLENTAGGDAAMARYLDSIDRLWSEIAPAAERSGLELGFCLDTCHFHAAGEDFADLVPRVRAITGRIDLVHANDSRDGFGSGADRHANLGSGEIEAKLLGSVLRETGAPILVETPGGEEGQSADIAWVREALAGG